MRLRTTASFSEVVTNDGVLLMPVNDAIPARKIWDPSPVHYLALRSSTKGNCISPIWLMVMA